MPELPEVETTRRGIEPLIVGATIAEVVVRDPRLRWPVPADLSRRVRRRRVRSVRRRGKYIVIGLDDGDLILHLGMSGSLRYLHESTAPRKHDHVDWIFVDGGTLRLSDPRRFGCLLHCDVASEHPLLRNLGPEPLDDGFSADYLYATCRGRTAAIKQHIMNARIVVGVGNIYANEALYRAGIHPQRAAGRISKPRTENLVAAIKAVLLEAIEHGGTTLRDFVGSDGRAGEPCARCGRPIRRIVSGQRSTFYCASCQR
jgi:formamidopyrimidine-DNA glycosylase